VSDSNSERAENAEARAESLQARVRELEEGVRPFAEYAKRSLEIWNGDQLLADDEPVEWLSGVKWGDFFLARSLLSHQPEGEAERERCSKCDKPVEGERHEAACGCVWHVECWDAATHLPEV
jgi:hypothetical protein